MITSGRHSRCLWGPGEGLGACSVDFFFLEFEKGEERVEKKEHGSIAKGKKQSSEVATQIAPTSHDLVFKPSGRLVRVVRGESEQEKEEKRSASRSCFCFVSRQPPSKRKRRLRPISSLRLFLFDGVQLTKIPPSLSSIQCLGALSLLRCFFGPRGILEKKKTFLFLKGRKKERKRSCELRDRSKQEERRKKFVFVSLFAVVTFFIFFFRSSRKQKQQNKHRRKSCQTPQPNPLPIT